VWWCIASGDFRNEVKKIAAEGGVPLAKRKEGQQD